MLTRGNRPWPRTLPRVSISEGGEASGHRLPTLAPLSAGATPDPSGRFPLTDHIH
jgi:hypothetical protein